jgi:hypothetical protein
VCTTDYGTDLQDEPPPESSPKGRALRTAVTHLTLSAEDLGLDTHFREPTMVPTKGRMDEREMFIFTDVVERDVDGCPNRSRKAAGIIESLPCQHREAGQWRLSFGKPKAAQPFHHLVGARVTMSQLWTGGTTTVALSIKIPSMIAHARRPSGRTVPLESGASRCGQRSSNAAARPDASRKRT